LIVCDSAPLIYLSKTGRLELLKQLYGEVLIPKGVFDEVVTQAVGKPGASEVQKAVGTRWVKVEVVSVPRSLRAEGAEGADGEVIVLAAKKGLPLLTNDRALAGIARTHRVALKWLTQTLPEAVRASVLSPLEARTLLRDLVRAGLRVRSEILAETINLIEKSEKQ